MEEQKLLKDHQDHLKFKKQGFEQERMQLTSDIHSSQSQLMKLTKELEVAKRTHRALLKKIKMTVNYLRNEINSLTELTENAIADLQNTRNEIRIRGEDTQRKMKAAFQDAIVRNPSTKR